MNSKFIISSCRIEDQTKKKTKIYICVLYNFFRLITWKGNEVYYIMRSKLKMGIVFLIVCISIGTISIQNKLNNQNETIVQKYVNIKNPDVETAGFWNNFTFIHITNLNWTSTGEKEWCSGAGTWSNPYIIENMKINASGSPIGCGILIENSVNVYFKLQNISIFGGSNGIMLLGTNNGIIIDSSLSSNKNSGINLINSNNNTISESIVFNNGLCGINLSSNSDNNRIIENTAKNQGGSLQDNGIFLQYFCDNNDIVDNSIYDNNVHGIVIEDDCQENCVLNNEIENIATSQQDYGIRIHNDCHQNTVSSNRFEDLNNYAIYIVTSDQTIITDNQLIDCSSGMYMLIDHQTIITGNSISGGSYGIMMSACDGGEISHNIINETTNYAIRIYINSDNNEIHDNIIKDNINLGIHLDDPSDINNKFYKNSFISNGIHAYDNGTTTSWSNLVVGNYWDDYTGEDLDNNHIGDIPYEISGSAIANDSLPIYDHGVPIITINSPTSSTYGTSAPQFNIYINDPYVYSMWYTINNSATRYYFSENGTINEEIWELLTEGNVQISFYVKDIAWNIGTNSVNIVKNISQSPENGPNDGAPPIDLIPILIISLIAISAIILAGILIRKATKKSDSPKKSKILNKEDYVRDQYFKDTNSILIILAIHKESGLPLSKISFHGGIGLDENLFTGYICYGQL